MSSHGRKFFVGGNWKCNGSRSSIEALVTSLRHGVPKSEDVEVVVAPPTIYLMLVQQQAPELALAAQNVHDQPKGAFTGEISAEMLVDCKIPWVILGHSERRNLFHDHDEFVAKKTQHALEVGLSVILCVGETLQEREANQTEQVVSNQLKFISEAVKDWSRVVIAYEPVWAIGTGKTASPQQAQEVHKSIRNWLKNNVSEKVANETRIIYGGSVNAKNANDLAKEEDVDGFLVGGASLIPEDFIKIVHASSEKKKAK